MCQAAVGKVLSVDGDRLTVSYNGKTRVLRSKLAGVAAGEYVQFSLDIAIDRIDKEEAEAILGDMQ
jgi:hydrogenase maturation factor